MQETSTQGRAFRFPAGFLWGAATSAHQVEGGNRTNDWWQAEQSGALPFASGDACDHYRRYATDFDLARSAGHNAHRLSIEWSRVEPEDGVFDEAALAHYQAVVQALRARGLEPVVTLHHFTNPVWLAARGGWLDRATPERFKRYAAVVARALAAEVRWWVTINEPTVYAKNAYVSGNWPPFGRGRWPASWRVVRQMVRAHALAYDALHEQNPDAMVGFAHSSPHVAPRAPAGPLDRLAAAARDFVLNRQPFLFLERDAPGKLDFIGVNYYCRTLVHWHWRGTAALFGRDWLADDQGAPRRYSDIGWEIHPPGLLAQLRALAAHGVPLLVTENGIATTDEALRLEYLQGHLAALGEAVAAGVPVRGYFYWSLMDNYEWSLGTAPRFGLAGTDFESQGRVPRPAMAYYTTVCRTGELPGEWPVGAPPVAAP